MFYSLLNELHLLMEGIHVVRWWDIPATFVSGYETQSQHHCELLLSSVFVHFKLCFSGFHCIFQNFIYDTISSVYFVNSQIILAFYLRYYQEKVICLKLYSIQWSCFVGCALNTKPLLIRHLPMMGHRCGISFLRLLKWLQMLTVLKNS